MCRRFGENLVVGDGAIGSRNVPSVLSVVW